MCYIKGDFANFPVNLIWKIFDSLFIPWCYCFLDHSPADSTTTSKGPGPSLFAGTYSTPKLVKYHVIVFCPWIVWSYQDGFKNTWDHELLARLIEDEIKVRDIDSVRSIFRELAQRRFFCSFSVFIFLFKIMCSHLKNGALTFSCCNILFQNLR